MRLVRIVALSFVVSSAALAWCAAQDKSPAKTEDSKCSCGEAAREERREQQKLAVSVHLMQKLSLNPFTDSKVGDWWLYSVKTVAGDKPVQHASLVWRVADTDGDDVRVTEEVSGEARPWLGKSRWFNRQDAPVLASVLPRELPSLAPLPGFLSGGRHLTKVADQKLEDEKRNISGEVFSTRRLSWLMVVEQDADKGRGSVETLTAALWVASDARSSIVGLQVKALGMEDVKAAYERAGFGSGGKADWGRAPEEGKK